MDKEIYKGNECSNLVMTAINDIADLVTKTMGPSGRTIILTDNHGNSKVTKDGYSVVKEIEFKDAIKNSAATLLKQVSKNTVEEAGDSTTTSICLARAIIRRGLHLMNKDKISYNKLKKELDILEEGVYQVLNKYRKKLSKNNIINVANISANGDYKVAKLIADAYKNAKIIRVEESDKQENSLDIINGMELNTGFFDKAFINNPSRQSIEYSNIPLMIVEGHLTELKHLAPIINKYPEGIIIVADHFSESVISIFKKLYNKGELKVGLVKSPGFATHRKDLLKDISLFTSTPILDQSKFIDTTLGIVDSVKITQDKFIISKSSVDPSVKEYTEELKESLKELTGTSKDLMEQRINNLTGSLAVIKVGGSTEVEMKEKKDRVDDAVLAVKCALEEGIIEGAGKVLYLNSSSISGLFGDCLKEPYNTIKANGAEVNLKDDLFKLGIIDPVKATRVAFKNALSVAKIILSTEGAVIANRVWI